MAKWKAVVDIRDLHDAFDKGCMSIACVADGVAKRLRRTRYADETQMLDIIEQLESIASDKEKADVEEYDYVLAELYNFGDDDHQLWVNTV